MSLCVNNLLRASEGSEQLGTSLGRRALAVCGPDFWNSLPPSLSTVISHSAFRHSLTTHFYNLAFYHDFIGYVMHARSI